MLTTKLKHPPHLRFLWMPNAQFDPFRLVERRYKKLQAQSIIGAFMIRIASWGILYFDHLGNMAEVSGIRRELQEDHGSWWIQIGCG